MQIELQMSWCNEIGSILAAHGYGIGYVFTMHLLFILFLFAPERERGP